MPIYGLEQFTDSQLFDTLNVVLPAWVLLALLPRWKHTYTIVTATALYVSLLYAACLATLMIAPSKDGAPVFSEMFALEGVSKLLAMKSAAVPCWAHYVAFDLWVGRWIATDSVDRAVPQLLLIPCLFLCLMVGPVGLIAYLVVRLPFNSKKATGAGARKSKSS